MLTIYTIPVSLYCAKLRILLRHKNLEWQEIAPPGGYGSTEYGQVVPAGNLPALKDGDLLISDSEAIAEYLNEKYPNPEMLPGDAPARAKLRQRSRFHDTRLEPAVRALFPHLSTPEHDPGFTKSQFDIIALRTKQFGQILDRDGPTTEELTLGDCGFPITFAWIEALIPLFGVDFIWPENITAYRDKIKQHPAVANELTDYVPKLSDLLSNTSRS